jgi:hypothetical protein
VSKGILIRLATIATTSLLSCSTDYAQNCTASGTPAWNGSIRNVIAGCPVEFVSPSGNLRLKFTSAGRIVVDSRALHWNGPQLEPPAMVSWSPKSNAFFLNDGDGSGLSSSFRLFKIEAGKVSEEATIEHAVVSLFRKRSRCVPTSADPNVWGFGWNSGGDQIYLLTQPTVNDSCGRPDQFISLIVRASDGAILEVLSRAQTKVKFGPILPTSLFVP